MQAVVRLIPDVDIKLFVLTVVGDMDSCMSNFFLITVLSLLSSIWTPHVYILM